MRDLPPAVQKAIQEQTKNARLKGLAKEVENGKTFYEAETTVNGHGRDLLFDGSGTLVEIEEETTLDSIPAPAKAAIEKKSAGGKLTKVETLTKGQTVTCEAAITKGGKKSEIVVAADGSVVKSFGSDKRRSILSAQPKRPALRPRPFPG